MTKNSKNNISDVPGCTGCGACAAVCPTLAAALRRDADGFLIARADAALCTDCGLCRKVCGRLTDAARGAKLADGQLWAVHSADADTVRASSSGGAAHELAVWAQENGVTPVGAVYDEKNACARHVPAETPAQLTALRGSKYLQSDCAGAWRGILSGAARGRRYLAFGTPCQIAGLARALEARGLRQNVLLAELFCHGVPGALLWERYLAEKSAKLGTDRPTAVFREKRADWHAYCLKLTGPAGDLRGYRERDPFWRLYFDDACLGAGCYDCRERGEASLADLRLGDFWGPSFSQNRDGVSAVLALTAAGESAMNALLQGGRLVRLPSGGYASLLRGQSLTPRPIPPGREAVLSGLRRGDSLARLSRQNRRTLPGKRRLELFLLTMSAALPLRLRTRLKRMLRRS